MSTLTRAQIRTQARALVLDDDPGGVYGVDDTRFNLLIDHSIALIKSTQDEVIWEEISTGMSAVAGVTFSTPNTGLDLGNQAIDYAEVVELFADTTDASDPVTLTARMDRLQAWEIDELYTESTAAGVPKYYAVERQGATGAAAGYATVGQMRVRFHPTADAGLSLFTVTTSNQKIDYSDGTTRVATISAGTYSAIDLASAVQTAMNVAVPGAWRCGYGFTISATFNDRLDISHVNEGNPVRSAQLTAGVYDGPGLAAEIQRALQAINASWSIFRCSYNVSTKFFDISTTTNTTFTAWAGLPTGGGVNAGHPTADRSAWPTIGMPCIDTAAVQGDLGLKFYASLNSTAMFTRDANKFWLQFYNQTYTAPVADLLWTSGANAANKAQTLLGFTNADVINFFDRQANNAVTSAGNAYYFNGYFRRRPGPLVDATVPDLSDVECYAAARLAAVLAAPLLNRPETVIDSLMEGLPMNLRPSQDLAERQNVFFAPKAGG